METNQSIGDRLRLLMEYYNLNKNSFSVKLGLQSNSVIVRIVNDPTRGISYEMLQRIGEMFTDIDLNWLITGAGRMLKVSKERPADVFNIKYFHDNSNEASDLMHIYGYKDCDFAFNDLVGDSMSSRFTQGDVFICKNIKPDQLLLGECYRIRLNDGRVFYRYATDIIENELSLSAENVRYKEVKVYLQDIDKIYLIRGFIRKVS